MPFYEPDVVAEAKKLGFTRCILPKVSLQNMQPVEGIRLEGVESVKDALRLVSK